MSERFEDRSVPPSLAVPLALVAVSLFLLMTFQTVQMIRDHGTLTNLRTSQETTVQESIKLRKQLETLAGKTAQLAADGDAGARTVVEQMRRQGVSLTTPKQ